MIIRSKFARISINPGKRGFESIIRERERERDSKEMKVNRRRRIQLGADGLFEASLTDVPTACAFAFLCGALLHDSAIGRCTMPADTSVSLNATKSIVSCA